MRRSRALLATAAVAGGALGAKRLVDARVASWDGNPDPTGGDPLSLPEGPQRSVTADDGARLHGDRCGDVDGPTVVLVHGFIESAGFWGPVAHRLADAGFDVVVVDQRGHGRSERGEAPYTTATLAADLRSWFEQLDLRDATVVGHSMGGVAAMAFATDEAPLAVERTRSLVLVTTLASPTRARSGSPRIGTERVMAVSERVLGLQNLGLFALLGTFGTRPARSALEVTRGAFLETDRATRVDAADMLQTFDLRASLPSISIPTLVVAGSHDKLTPLPTNEAIAESIPDARLEVLPGRGHMLAFEAPDELTDLVIQATKPTDR